MRAEASGLLRRRRAFRRGVLAEWIAVLWLMLQGYRLLARRYQTPAGEIDLLMRRGRLLVAVEVKQRRRLEDAWELVMPRQQRRIAAALDIYVQRHPAFLLFDRRFDLVLLTPYALPRHSRGAWHLDT